MIAPYAYSGNQFAIALGCDENYGHEWVDNNQNSVHFNEVTHVFTRNGVGDYTVSLYPGTGYYDSGTGTDSVMLAIFDGEDIERYQGKSVVAENADPKAVYNKNVPLTTVAEETLDPGNGIETSE